MRLVSASQHALLDARRVDLADEALQRLQAAAEVLLLRPTAQERRRLLGVWMEARCRRLLRVITVTIWRGKHAIQAGAKTGQQRNRRASQGGRDFV